MRRLFSIDACFDSRAPVRGDHIYSKTGNAYKLSTQGCVPLLKDSSGLANGILDCPRSILPGTYSVLQTINMTSSNYSDSSGPKSSVIKKCITGVNESSEKRTLEFNLCYHEKTRPEATLKTLGTLALEDVVDCFKTDATEISEANAYWRRDANGEFIKLH